MAKGSKKPPQRKPTPPPTEQIKKGGKADTSRNYVKKGARDGRKG